MNRYVEIGIFAFAFTLALPGKAAAQGNSNGWDVCNETSYIIEAATGRYEGQGVVVEGERTCRQQSRYN